VQRETNESVVQKSHHSYTLDIWYSNSGREIVFLDHLPTGKKKLFDKKNATGNKA
jgi:hypothetical protein